MASAGWVNFLFCTFLFSFLSLEAWRFSLLPSAEKMPHHISFAFAPSPRSVAQSECREIKNTPNVFPLPSERLTQHSRQPVGERQSEGFGAVAVQASHYDGVAGLCSSVR